MKLLILIFDWDEKALLGNEEKVFSGIPSIEKKISDKLLSFKLFDLF